VRFMCSLQRGDLRLLARRLGGCGVPAMGRLEVVETELGARNRMGDEMTEIDWAEGLPMQVTGAKNPKSSWGETCPYGDLELVRMVKQLQQTLGSSAEREAAHLVVKSAKKMRHLTWMTLSTGQREGLVLEINRAKRLLKGPKSWKTRSPWKH